MEPLEYLRALRRRWLLIAAAVGVAVAVAWVTGTVVPAGPPVRSYQANTVILQDATLPSTDSVSLEAIAALVGVGEVPRRAVETLGRPENPVELAGNITSVADKDTGQLTITAISTDAVEAELLADTFAEELIVFLGESRAERSAQTAEQLGAQLDKLTKEIAALDGRIARSGGSRSELLVAERDAKIRQYGFLYEQVQTARAAPSTAAGLQIIQPAKALSTDDGGFQAPRSQTMRALLAGILGLLTGVSLALVLDRFDTRIRDKRAAEKHFKHPVLVEIPFLGRRRRRDLNVTGARGKSLAVDSFRMLAAGLIRPRAGSGNGDGRATERERARTVMVTSAGPAEGKSTVVANLAAALADFGRTVIVLSCDFRRPRIHRLFGIPNDKGLAHALESSSYTDAVLKGHVYRTKVEQVRVVPSGPPPERPTELLSSEAMSWAIAEARAEADVVLIDTAPVLVSSDATHMLSEVDGVLLVARARRTTANVAERTTELLERFGAPVAGVALNAVREARVPRHYYYYYGEPKRGLRGFPGFRGTDKGAKV